MNGSATYCDWVAVDWGTSALRAWAMRGHECVAEERSDKGMNSLEKSGYEAALLELVHPWLGSGPTPVLVCGMAGARQGWAEAPYRAVPCKPLAGKGVRVATADSRLSVTILPGLKQEDPADVMRGEETQIAGYLSERPNFDGVVCLPGTHSKWAEISAGEVVSFRTFMTGELFDLVARRSVLRHSTGAGWDAGAFADALADTLSRPESLGGKLFSIRAETLLHDLAPAAATARLSGLLIGAELAAARPYWLGRELIVIGAEPLATRYCEALELQGVPARHVDAETMTRAGLSAARSAAREVAE